MEVAAGRRREELAPDLDRLAHVARGERAVRDVNMNKRNAHDTMLNAGLIASALVVLLVALIDGPAAEVAKAVLAVTVA